MIADKERRLVFGNDDLPATFRAQQFRAVGGRQRELTPLLRDCRETHRPVEAVERAPLGRA